MISRGIYNIPGGLGRMACCGHTRIACYGHTYLHVPRSCQNCTVLLVTKQQWKATSEIVLFCFTIVQTTSELISSMAALAKYGRQCCALISQMPFILLNPNPYSNPNLAPGKTSLSVVPRLKQRSQVWQRRHHSLALKDFKKIGDYSYVRKVYEKIKIKSN